MPARRSGNAIGPCRADGVFVTGGTGYIGRPLTYADLQIRIAQDRSTHPNSSRLRRQTRRLESLGRTSPSAPPSRSKESVMTRLVKGLIAAGLCASAAATLQGSSHREALAILNEPCADNTDT